MAYKSIRAGINDQFNITLILLCRKDSEVGTIRVQRHRGGGFYLGTSLSTRVFTKDQIYFDSKDAVIKEIANYIQKYTDEFCGCDSIMLNGDDGAKIIPELALAGIKFDGVEGKVNLDTEWQEIQKERNRF